MVPFCADALVTGAMAIMLAQMLNPEGSVSGCSRGVAAGPSAPGSHDPRGRCLGVAGLSAVMLMLRALALAAESDVPAGIHDTLVTMSLDDPGLNGMLAVWVSGVLLGVLLIATGLFRSRVTPA